MPRTACKSSQLGPVTLRMIAHRVGLAPCSVSAVLNDTPASKRIPLRTKNRILRAAERLNYRPNLSARALRTRHTRIVGVLAGDLGKPEVGLVIGAVERELRKRGYLVLLSSAGEGIESCPSTFCRLHRKDGLRSMRSCTAQVLRELPFRSGGRQWKTNDKRPL